MRLLSVVLENYRVHGLLEVELHPRLTVLCGPNEAGKSTLVEAIGAALAVPHRTGGEIQRGMRNVRGGIPRVVLRFSAGPADGSQTWEVEKSFGGAGGRSRCRLRRMQPTEAWEGEAAEAELQRLLGRTGGGRNARDIDERLKAVEYMLVRQGLSTADPLAVPESSDLLFEALRGQQHALLVPQTGADRRLLAALRESVEKTRKASGWRKDSEPWKLEQRIGELVDRAGALRGQIAEREGRVQEVLADEDRLALDVPTLEVRKQEIFAGRAELEGVVRLVEEQRKVGEELKALDGQIRQIREADANLARLRKELVEAEQAAAGTAAAVAELRGGLSGLDQQIAALKKEVQNWDAQVVQIESWLEVARVQDRLVKAREQRAKCEESQARRQNVLLELEQVRVKLGGLAEIERKDVKRLRGLEAKASEARTALSGIATAVRWSAGPGPVLLDGADLAQGERRQITEDATLRLGDGIEVQVVPGGGESVAERRQEARDTAEALATALAKVSAESVDAAERIAEERAGLKAQSDQLGAKLDELADQSAMLQELAGQIATLEGRVTDFREKGVEVPEGTDVQDFEQMLVGLKSERKAEQARQADAEQKRSAMQAELEQRQADQSIQQRVTELGTRVRVLEERLGTADERSGRLAALEAQRPELEERVQKLELELGGRQADVLAKRLEREEKDWGRLRDEITARRERVKVLRGQLAESVTSDPVGELEAVEGDRERAERALDAVRNRCDGEKLLLETLEKLLRRQQEMVEAPFCDAVGAYLRLAFGGDAAVGLSDAKVGGASARTVGQVQREGAGLGSFGFVELSTGTRELIGVCIRLAMAQTVAQRQADGCLPVVLDDSFANVDPQRLRVVGDLIDLATRNGLQVILLTCNDRELTGLGDCERRELPRARFAGGMRPSMNREMEDGEEAEAAEGVSRAGRPASVAGDRSASGPGDVSVDAADEEAFVEALRLEGGSASTRRLREVLEWHVERFNAVRAALEHSGRARLIPGTRTVELSER